MSERDVLDRLLRLEREHDDLPAGAESRILAAVEAAIIGGNDGGGNDGSGNDGGGNQGSGDSPAPADSTNHDTRSPHSGASHAHGGSRLAKTTATVSNAFVRWLAPIAYVTGGAVLGASGHAMLAPAPHANASTSSAPSTPAAPPGSSTRPLVEVAANTLGAPSLVPSSSASAAPLTASAATAAVDLPVKRATELKALEADMAAERADLDVARAAFARGRIDACLNALEAYARAHHHGHFEEEREALLIQALSAAHRGDEASLRADRFFRRFPQSLFGPAVRQSLEADR